LNSSIFLGLKPIEDANWLYWFIGFSEGDGAILTYKNRLEYVLTQIKKRVKFYMISNIYVQ